MAAGTPPVVPDLILFVSGEPGPGEDSMRDVETSMGRRLMGTIIPPAWFRPPGTLGFPPGNAPTAEAPTAVVRWHLGREGTRMVNLVLDVAQRAGREVTLVNVNGAGEYEGLVQQWMGPEDILPVLLRPDGQRLIGIEQLGPDRILRFLRR